MYGLNWRCIMKKEIVCSFCGKSQHEVKKLIAGPSVFICDECVDLCNDIITEEIEEAEDVFNGEYELSSIAKAYFKDMNEVLKECYRVLKKGGKAAIIVGNGCFSSGVIESDMLLTELAENLGFKTENIRVLNKRMCMKERTKKVGIMRESLLTLEK